MHPEEKEFREENRFIASVAQRVLRDDPLLLPYFEDGVFRMTDCPEEEFTWFTPGLPAETREFIDEEAEELNERLAGVGEVKEFLRRLYRSRRARTARRRSSGR